MLFFTLLLTAMSRNVMRNVPQCIARCFAMFLFILLCVTLCRTLRNSAVNLRPGKPFEHLHQFFTLSRSHRNLYFIFKHHIASIRLFKAFDVANINQE